VKSLVNSLILEEKWIAAYIDQSTSELILLHEHDFHLNKKYQYENFKSIFRFLYWSSLSIPTVFFVIMRVFIASLGPIDDIVEIVPIGLLSGLLSSVIPLVNLLPLEELIRLRRERTLYIIIKAERTTDLNDIAKKAGLSVTKVKSIVGDMIYAGILEHMYINHRTQEIVRINPNQE
jgi:hypothetical protein